jgi:hypothetical protein
MLVGEDYSFGPTPPYDAEFHQGLIVTSGVITYRPVFGLVPIDEENAPEQYSVWLERWMGGGGPDEVGRRRPLFFL